MDKRYPGKHDISTKCLAGLIPISGQTITHSSMRRERGITDGRQMVYEFARLYHANEVGPPCICICGSEDMELRCAENIYFVEARYVFAVGCS